MSTLKTDLLFCMLFALITFIVVLISQINPPTETEKEHRPGNMVVSIAWPEGSDDVDVWLSGPGDRAVGYGYKSGLVWSLLRDDLGITGDQTPFNFESAYSRGLPNGDYGVNVHCYKCGGPVEVFVEIGIAGGSKVWAGKVTVAHKQERTALRWTMREGALVQGSATQVFKPVRGAM